MFLKLVGLQKSIIPSSDDEVWRLKKIAKGGVFHLKLQQSRIHSVEDFLRMYYKDEKALRNVRQEFCLYLSFPKVGS
jgi:hypothetical protein